MELSNSFRFMCCPCCESKNLAEKLYNPTCRKIENWRQFFYGGEAYIPRIVLCRDCGFHFIDPIDSDADSYYRDADILDYTNLSHHRLKYFSLIKRQIEHKGITLPTRPSILDLGAATGEWLFFWHGCAKLYATETNLKYIPLLRNKEILVGSSVQDFHNKFDLISAFDFLEHVPDPHETIRSLIKALNPGGYLVFGVPDMGKIIVWLLGFRYYLYCPMHVSYFNSNCLRALLKRATNGEPKIFKSPPMSTSLAGALKWISPKLAHPAFNKIEVPGGYSASLIATVQVNR